MTRDEDTERLLERALGAIPAAPEGEARKQ